MLWRGEDAAPLTHKELAYRVHKAMSRVELGKKGPHTLRHTFCSHLAMRGVSAVKIQKLAGHAKLSTTQIYLHLAPGAEHPRRRDRGPREVAVGTGTTTEPR